MKEFEKWYENITNGVPGFFQTDLMKESWKAALEWVLTHKQTILFAKEKEDIGKPVSFVETNIIKQELEKTNDIIKQTTNQETASKSPACPGVRKTKSRQTTETLCGPE